MKFIIVELYLVLILIPLRPKYWPQDLFYLCLHSSLYVRGLVPQQYYSYY
jgi:hypothetical protein